MVTLLLSEEFYEWTDRDYSDPVFTFRLKKDAPPEVVEEYNMARGVFEHLYGPFHKKKGK